MYKELIISIIIVVSIIFLNDITTKYLEESTQIISEDLKELKQKEGEDEQKKQIEKVLEDWEKRYDKLAYYIEHNELEKVKTKIINVKSDIETAEEGQKIQNIDEAVYLLEHIRDKDSLNLKDIF